MKLDTSIDKCSARLPVHQTHLSGMSTVKNV
jgi:hypothetical protein